MFGEPTVREFFKKLVILISGALALLVLIYWLLSTFTDLSKYI